MRSQEGIQCRVECGRGFHIGQMSGAFDADKLCAGYVVAHESGDGQRSEEILGADDDQCRDGDGGKEMQVIPAVGPAAMGCSSAFRFCGAHPFVRWLVDGGVVQRRLCNVLMDRFIGMFYHSVREDGFGQFEPAGGGFGCFASRVGVDDNEGIASPREKTIDVQCYLAAHGKADEDGFIDTPFVEEMDDIQGHFIEHDPGKGDIAVPISAEVGKDEPVIGCKEVDLQVPHGPVKGMAVDKDEGLTLTKIVVSEMYSSYFFYRHGVWFLTF